MIRRLVLFIFCLLLVSAPVLAITDPKAEGITLGNVADLTVMGTLTGHGAVIHSIDISPDSTMMVTGDGNGRVILWDLQAQEQVAQFTHTNDVNRVRFSPDSSKVITASSDNTSKIWDYATDTVVTFAGHNDWLWDVDMSPDGGKVVSVSCGDRDGGCIAGQIFVWDATTGDVIESITAHTDTIYGVSFSDDGRYFATAAQDGASIVWDAETYDQVQMIETTENWLYDVVFDPDATIFATGGADYILKIWDIETGQLLHSLTGHEGALGRNDFHPSGEMVVTASRDGSANIWNPATGDLLVALEPAEGGEVSAAKFSPDGSLLVVSSGTFSGANTLYIYGLEEDE